MGKPTFLHFQEGENEQLLQEAFKAFQKGQKEVQFAGRTWRLEQGWSTEVFRVTTAVEAQISVMRPRNGRSMVRLILTELAGEKEGKSYCPAFLGQVQNRADGRIGSHFYDPDADAEAKGKLKATTKACTVADLKPSDILTPDEALGIKRARLLNPDDPIHEEIRAMAEEAGTGQVRVQGVAL